MLKEKEAEFEVNKHMNRKENAKDANTKKDAEECEQRARLKQKGSSHVLFSGLDEAGYLIVFCSLCKCKAVLAFIKVY